MPRLRLLVSDSHDPLFNLAVEECIFRQMDPGRRVLFLWRNANTVVIGRAQNPWKECNTRRMEEDGVTLARRSSGGGAVFRARGLEKTCGGIRRVCSGAGLVAHTATAQQPHLAARCGAARMGGDQGR